MIAFIYNVGLLATNETIVEKSEPLTMKRVNVEQIYTSMNKGHAASFLIVDPLTHTPLSDKC